MESVSIPALGTQPVADGDLLRLLVAGSVDSGKSTLIGRLLYDAKLLLSDQIEALENTSIARGEVDLDLSLITDGLRAEREQGITIDVAYRYFSTPQRAFIVADTPGHVTYTRNMVTGASNSDVALLLVEAPTGAVGPTVSIARTRSTGIRGRRCCTNWRMSRSSPTSTSATIAFQCKQ